MRIGYTTWGMPRVAVDQALEHLRKGVCRDRQFPKMKG